MNIWVDEEAFRMGVLEVIIDLEGEEAPETLTLQDGTKLDIGLSDITTADDQEVFEVTGVEGSALEKHHREQTITDGNGKVIKKEGEI